MEVRLAMAGDTMLGRGVAERLATSPPPSLFSDELREITREADLFVLNLECCISERGTPWPAAGKPFFFRAPPAAGETLRSVGVDCVTLANNHALDFGFDALADTFGYLADAGISYVGAGPNVERARCAAVIEAASGFRLAVIGVTDHPSDYAAGEDRGGVAFADLRSGVPDWLSEAITSTTADAVLVTPHWGPNMVSEPLDHVISAGHELVGAGADLVAGHSAHVFHGVKPPILYDLGDFIDDYAVDPALRNDLGLLFIATLRGAELVRLEAIPLALDYCHTAVANGDAARWIRTRFTSACERLGTEVSSEEGRLVVNA